VRWAQRHAACDVIGIRRGFDENDLYANLTWLSQHQESIEKRLFAKRSGQKPNLFLYDVTSSYLEGKCHAYGAYGYNRDGKKTRSRWSSACCATSRHAGLDGGFSRQHARSENIRRAGEEGE